MSDNRIAARFKSAISAVVIALLLITVSPASASSPAWESLDVSTQENVARAVVQGSPEFRAEAVAQRDVGARFDFKRGTIEVDGPYAVVVVPSFAKDRSVILSMLVDVESRSLEAVRKIVVTPNAAGSARMQVIDDGAMVYSGVFDATTGEFAAGAGFEHVDAATAEAPGTGTCALQAGDATIMASNWCVGIVTALCGTGGGIGCYLACAALGLVSGVGGLTCAGVCGLIGALGCWGAVSAICR